MQPFHMQALIAELRRPEYSGLEADAAYALLTGRKQQVSTGKLIDTRSEAEKRLGAVRFIPQSVWNALRDKDRARLPTAIVIDDETANGFAYTYGQDKEGNGGQVGYDIPGFPNKVRRHEFDEAWRLK